MENLTELFNTAAFKVMELKPKEEVRNVLDLLYKKATSTEDEDSAGAMRQFIDIVNSLQKGPIPSPTSSIAPAIPYSKQRDFLFCKLCGTMLKFTPSYAECPLCKTRSSLEGIVGKEITYTYSAEDIRKYSGMTEMEAETPQLPKVNQKCERCGNGEAFFQSKQIRSGSKGQTAFFRCSHQFQAN